MLKSTKIIATLGPASSSAEVMEELIKNGVNLFRLNFSHGTHREHEAKIKLIREVEAKTGVSVGIIQDLQGPKIRLGELAEDIFLKKGEEITLALKGDIPVQYNIFPHLTVGDRIFINDGLVLLKVLETGKESAKCSVATPGKISTHKGLNLPDTHIADAGFTEKDKEDLMFGLKNSVDFVALSFVQKPIDIEKLRSYFPKTNAPKIIAKIETQQAVNNLKEIIDVSDAIMVARGDLAIEVGQEEVPILQRDMIALAKLCSKPVIVATQMLESMITNAQPTRAEVSDVATAVLDDADCIMLSGETAAGAYPVEAVAFMTKIAKRVEKHKTDTELSDPSQTYLTHLTEKTVAIAQAATLMSLRLNASCIVNVTSSGFTASQIANYRPRTPIIVASDNERVVRQLTLTYGVHPILIKKIVDNDEVLNEIKKTEIGKDYITNDPVIFVTGNKPGVPGGTDTIRVI